MRSLLLAWGQCIRFFLPGVNAFASSCLGSVLAWVQCIRFLLPGVNAAQHGCSCNMHITPAHQLTHAVSDLMLFVLSHS